MSLQKYAGFVGPSYTSQSRIAAYDRTLNWYCERIESGTGVTTYVLYPVPGYETLSTMPTSPGRVIFALNGTAYAIAGSALYDVTAAPVLRAQGLSDLHGGAVAQIVSNGDAGGQLLFRADTTLYALDLNAPVSETTFLDPPASAPNPTGILGANPIPPMVDGFYGYAVTFITDTGETTPSPVAAFFIDNADPSGLFKAIWVQGIPLGAGIVSSRKVYRTAVQATEVAALSAQLKLLTTIADNVTTAYVDENLDAALGANVPTVNTASITIDALTVIPDITSNMIAYLNLYGLSLDASRSEVRFSGLSDFSSWDPLDVFQRSDAPDRWVAMLVHHREIWLFGTETSSVYGNTTDPDIPFQPFQFIPIGIAAPNTALVVDGNPMWLGRGVDGACVVYRANGYTPDRVSTHAIELLLSGLRGFPDSEARTYQENGHVFYEITVPASGDSPSATVDYDTTAGLWHERGESETSGLDARGHAFNAETHMVLSRTTGSVYRQSTDLSTGTNGLGMVRLRRAPHINVSQRRIRYSRFRLLTQVGNGLGDVPSTTVGYDPQIMLSWSNDGGQTFGTSYPASTGRIGAFDTMVEWFQLEQARDRIFELRYSAPVFRPLIDAFLEFSVGPS